MVPDRGGSRASGCGSQSGLDQRGDLQANECGKKCVPAEQVDDYI